MKFVACEILRDDESMNFHVDSGRKAVINGFQTLSIERHSKKLPFDVGHIKFYYTTISNTIAF